MATDLVARRECRLRDIRVTGLSRWPANIWPENQSQHISLPGQVLQVIVTLGDRFPIKAARVDAITPWGEPAVGSPVGWVPFPEQATHLPDPLLQQPCADLPANSTQSFLLKLEIPAGLEPGAYAVDITASSASHASISTQISLGVYAPPAYATAEDGIGIAPACNFWPQWDSFARQYGEELWSEPFWVLAETYLKELAEAGMNVAMVSICHDPFRYPLPPEHYHQHHIPTMVQWHRSSNGAYWFDYSVYDRYVELCHRLGIDREIECHSMLPCQAQDPVLEYWDDATHELVSYSTSYDAPDYREAWRSFLADFAAHNRAHGWLEKVSLCPYDEPQNLDSFRAVARLAKKIAPQIRITAAITADRALQLTDVLDIATLHAEVGYSTEAHQELTARGLDVRWYNCCEPRWANTLFCCDLSEAYRVPWVTAANHFSGYLRWAVFNWTSKPWKDPVFNWPTGDMYLLYPGARGPASSLRWEAYRTGREDLELALASLPHLDGSAREELQAHLDLLGTPGPLNSSGSIGEWRSKLVEILTSASPAIEPAPVLAA